MNLVRGVSRSMMPFSHSFITRYANTGLRIARHFATRQVPFSERPSRELFSTGSFLLT